MNSIDRLHCRGHNKLEKECAASVGYLELKIEEISCALGWKWSGESLSCI